MDNRSSIDRRVANGSRADSGLPPLPNRPGSASGTVERPPLTLEPLPRPPAATGDRTLPPLRPLSAATGSALRSSSSFQLPPGTAEDRRRQQTHPLYHENASARPFYSANPTPSPVHLRLEATMPSGQSSGISSSSSIPRSRPNTAGPVFHVVDRPAMKLSKAAAGHMNAVLSPIRGSSATSESDRGEDRPPSVATGLTRPSTASPSDVRLLSPLNASTPARSQTAMSGQSTFTASHVATIPSAEEFYTSVSGKTGVVPNSVVLKRLCGHRGHVDPAAVNEFDFYALMNGSSRQEEQTSSALGGVEGPHLFHLTTPGVQAVKDSPLMEVEYSRDTILSNNNTPGTRGGMEEHRSMSSTDMRGINWGLNNSFPGVPPPPAADCLNRNHSLDRHRRPDSRLALLNWSAKDGLTSPRTRT